MTWLAVRLPGVERRFLAAVAVGADGPVPLASGAAGRLRLAGVTGNSRATARAIALLPPSPANATLIRAETSENRPVSPAFPLSPPAVALPGAVLPNAESIRAATAPPTGPDGVASPGFDLATRAYAALATGDRRAAERLFGAALAAAGTPAPPQAEAWRGAQRRLDRHWSGEAYTLRRDTGVAEGAAATPVLGGGQSGGTLAYALDPLAPRPVAVIGRIYAAHASGGGIDGATAQGAVGLRWQVTPGLALAAERLVAVGKNTSGDWNLRVAGGGQARRGRVTIDGYAEAGVRGNGDAYAGAQARATTEIGRAGRLVFSAGPGAWGSIQHAQSTVGRLDLGAGVTATTPVGVTISADWRWRVTGNAAPGSGPAVTVSAAF